MRIQRVVRYICGYDTDQKPTWYLLRALKLSWLELGLEPRKGSPVILWSISRLGGLRMDRAVRDGDMEEREQ